MATREARLNDKSQNEKNQKVLRDLLKIPENKKCADCKVKGALIINL